MTDAMMVEAIRSVKMNQTDAAGAANAPQAVANPDAVAQFQAAMEVEQTEASANVEPVPFASQVAAEWRTAQTYNQGLLHRIRTLAEMNGTEGFSMASMAELQYEVASLSFQQEVVAKVADKSSNAVQTLIKNQ